MPAMMLSQPLTPVDEGAEPEPLVLSVGALRCRVANAKHLYTRIDECIRGTTYSQNRPSTFHNEERDILFQVGQDLEQIYDALIGIMMNAPRRGASQYAVDFAVEEQLNDVRAHLLNVCHSAQQLDSASASTREAIEAVINFAEPNQDARPSPRTTMTTIAQDENTCASLNASVRSSTSAYDSEAPDKPAAVAAVADGALSRRASLPRESSSVPSVRSISNSPVREPLAPAAAAAAPGSIERRLSLPRDAAALEPLAAHFERPHAEPPYRAFAPRRLEFVGEPEAGDAADAPRPRAARPAPRAAPRAAAAPLPLSAEALAAHNEQLAAQRVAGGVGGDRGDARLRTAQALEQAESATAPPQPSRQRSAPTASATCTARGDEVSTTCGAGGSGGGDGRAHRAVAAALAAAALSFVAVVAALPGTRGRLDALLLDCDDPRVRRRRQPKCFESNTRWL